jgi:hypothetical protein
MNAAQLQPVTFATVITAMTVDILLGMTDAELIAACTDPTSPAYKFVTDTDRSHAEEQLRLRAPQTIDEFRNRRTRNAAVDAATRAAEYLRSRLAARCRSCWRVIVARGLSTEERSS